MGGVYGAVMVFTFAVSAVTLARATAPARAVDLVLITFLVGSAEILLSGYVLSALNAFGSAGAWAAFAAYRDPRAREEHSYWGVLGFGLLWIVPWVAVPGARPGAGRGNLAVAAIVYLLTVAFTAEYDPWRGRLFMAMGMFAIPVVVCFLEERRGGKWRLFLLAVVLAGCLSAISAVVFREHGTLVSARYGERSVTSIFLQDRAGQMTSDIPR